MNRTLKIVIITITVFVGFGAVPFIVAPILNNFSMSGFSQQLTEYKLPANTQKIASKSACGKLNGNGNGMDFMAVMLVKSDLSMRVLHEYYDNAQFKPVHDSRKYNSIIEVITPGSTIVQSELLKHQQIEFKQLDGICSFEGYFFVILYDGGYEAPFDLRGH